MSFLHKLAEFLSPAELSRSRVDPVADAARIMARRAIIMRGDRKSRERARMIAVTDALRKMHDLPEWEWKA